MVAGIRLLTCVILLYFPLRYFFSTPELRSERAWVVWVALGLLAEALVVYSAVKRSWGRGWIGFFSGILDVTLVSVTLGLFLRDTPPKVVSDLLIFPIYLLAIGATSLRYDWRICVLTGMAAIGQYLSLVLYVLWLGDSTSWVEEILWAEQGGRLLLLAAATALSMMLVLRALEQRSLSNHDRLTMLANRGFFDESLMRIGALAARSGESVAVAMIDIDHFKRFNDTYGHMVGDEVLRTVGRILATTFRNTDLLARYGGEEFTGLFPGLTIESAALRLSDLRATIASTPVATDGRGGTTRVTVSIGVATWPTDGVNLKETLAIADLRLYQAKQNGRNRVVASGAVEDAPVAGLADDETTHESSPTV
jgi:two-component system cell cycle response regulator